MRNDGSQLIRGSRLRQMVKDRFKSLEKSGVEVYELLDDDLQFTLIQATLMETLLDPTTKPGQKTSAAKELAAIKGLDKKSKLEENAQNIRALRDAIKVDEPLVEVKVIEESHGTTSESRDDDSESDPSLPTH